MTGGRLCQDYWSEINTSETGRLENGREETGVSGGKDEESGGKKRPETGPETDDRPSSMRRLGCNLMFIALQSPHFLCPFSAPLKGKCAENEDQQDGASAPFIR
ncbi:MAG: hypothetical protein IJV27_04525 [Prevotella sp.]|nr:hypothetical protein [Prevotella sp.]